MRQRFTGDDDGAGRHGRIAVWVGVGDDVPLLSIFPGVPVGGTVISFEAAGLTTIGDSDALIAVVAVALSEDLGEPSS